jgi:RNA polymerase sigma-70 factor (ECF subfamily)
VLEGSMVRRALAPPALDGSADDAQDDALVLRRVANGDARALEALYQRHAAALFGYLLALNRERTVAEEVLQDTFLAAWHAAGSFRGGASVRTWLFAIARRQARDRRRRYQPVVVDDEEYLATADPSPGPEQAALDRAELQDLVAGINALGPLHREALALVFVHELSYAEAAQVLEVPIGTVRSRLSAARRLLHMRRNAGRESAHDE